MNLLRLLLLLLQLTTPFALGETVGISPNGPLPALIGDGQCVTAAHYFSDVPRDTSKWQRGKPVVVNGEVNPNIPDGTAVATYDSNGQYFPTSGQKDCGIYIKRPDTKGSFWLLDQWPTQRDADGNVVREGMPPHLRSISPNGAYPSDNSSAYYVIVVP
jgi:hypothetical protein